MIYTLELKKKILVLKYKNLCFYLAYLKLSKETIITDIYSQIRQNSNKYSQKCV